MATIRQDMAAYEKWLRKQCDVVEQDLEAKHRRMRKRPFDFLRATYFRWARTIESVCPELADTPRVLCIGDIHIENYGTWRDADSRLVWGINDFDEAAVMPCAYDLVRLTTSALLAPDLPVSAADVSRAVLRGYRSGLKTPGAVLLDEDAGWLRPYANPTERTNSDFWKEVDGYPDARPPAKVKRALRNSLPKGAEVVRYASRTKGVGSLGRPRFVAIASWNSGRLLREAKALVPSGWDWAHEAVKPSRALDVAYGPFRSPDPHLRCEQNFILRRIAPDSRKIEVADGEVLDLTDDLIAAMARDLASVHMASAQGTRIAQALASRPRRWLRDAAEAARRATEEDFASYAAPGKLGAI